MNQLSSASRTAYANLFTGTSDSTPLDSTPLDATPINSTPLASPDIFQKIKNNPHELCELRLFSVPSSPELISTSTSSQAWEYRKFSSTPASPSIRGVAINQLPITSRVVPHQQCIEIGTERPSFEKSIAPDIASLQKELFGDSKPLPLKEFLNAHTKPVNMKQPD
ncbi:hypothetical protein [Paraburkholderia bonniea]|uniref:hypothetical protein n=1 Tax=Paraburkholderia bonniea TaxID=2152891 RepID=UPI00129142F8|nr:hypothetical protein [Paraburkholderia bonniea]